MSKPPISNAMARVLMAAAQNLVISPITPTSNEQEHRLRVGARFDQGYLRMARLAEKQGYLKIGQRSNGMYWVHLTDDGRRALAEYRNGPPSAHEQLLEIAAAAGVDAETMKERLIFTAWREHAGWARDLPTLKAAMVAAHPDKGGEHVAFIEAHRRYEAVKRVSKRGVRTRKTPSKNTAWAPA